MPRMRLLADLAAAPGSAINGSDANGNPVFDVAPGDLVPVVLDATGWAGADSVASSAWESADGLTLSAQVLTGATASCAAYVPDGNNRQAYRLHNTLTLSSGPVRRTLVWLRARPHG